MVSSFKFGLRSPKSLGEIYKQGLKQERSSQPILNLTNSWWAPVYGGQCGVHNQYCVVCGSTAHTNGADHAADVSVTIGTSIYAANSGTVETKGWDPSGFGLMWKINTNGDRHYYAHLSQIAAFKPNVGEPISRGRYLGKSGSSGLGNPDNEHLHFHVQDGQFQNSSSGVSLVDMTGFTNWPDYPGQPNGISVTCGLMGR